MLLFQVKKQLFGFLSPLDPGFKSWQNLLPDLLLTLLLELQLLGIVFRQGGLEPGTFHGQHKVFPFILGVNTTPQLPSIRQGDHIDSQLIERQIRLAGQC